MTYVHCQHHDTTSTIARLGHCVDDVDHCMVANRLQMNPAKTMVFLHKLFESP